MNVDDRARWTLAQALREQGIEVRERGGETYAVVDGTEIRVLVSVADAAVSIEPACPKCGHDVDHTGPCPAGCPMCEPPVYCDRCGKDLVREAHQPGCSVAGRL